MSNERDLENRRISLHTLIPTVLIAKVAHQSKQTIWSRDEETTCKDMLRSCLVSVFNGAIAISYVNEGPESPF